MAGRGRKRNEGESYASRPHLASPGKQPPRLPRVARLSEACVPLASPLHSQSRTPLRGVRPLHPRLHSQSRTPRSGVRLSSSSQSRTPLRGVRPLRPACTHNLARLGAACDSRLPHKVARLSEACVPLRPPCTHKVARLSEACVPLASPLHSQSRTPLRGVCHSCIKGNGVRPL